MGPRVKPEGDGWVWLADITTAAETTHFPYLIAAEFVIDDIGCRGPLIIRLNNGRKFEKHDKNSVIGHN